ncbi:MAG: sulfatase-like hydrolase/transferase [Anaerolineae bacterium]
MRKSKSIHKYLHPFLFGIYPLLFLYATNAGKIRPADVVRPGLIILILTCIITLIIARYISEKGRSTLILSFFYLMFFSFGHILGILNKIGLVSKTQPQRYIFLTLWVFLLVAGCLGIWRLRVIESITNVAIIVILTLLAFPIQGSVAFHFRERANHAVTTIKRAEITAPAKLRTDNLPDIYYIILDGYGRADVLNSIYGFDNSKFIAYLEQKGFFVASNSITNYNRTVLSLSSSTNLEYINYLTESEGRDSTNYEIFAEMISTSRSRNLLENAGYKIVTIASGFWATEVDDTDVYLVSPASFSSEFERLLLLNTPLGILPGFARFLSYEAHRQRVLFAFDELKQLSRENNPTPRFIFAHILSPHPPFVFGQNGERVNPSYSHYTLRDGNDFLGTREEYMRGYQNQLQYLNSLVMDTIEYILDNSANPPVIILQGDHGPGAYTNFESVEKSCNYERSAILNAYYFPDGRTDMLYPSITPVNSFRVIFDTYLNTNFNLLEDKSYFGPTPHLLDLTDITNRIDISRCQLP